MAARGQVLQGLLSLVSNGGAFQFNCCFFFNSGGGGGGVTPEREGTRKRIMSNYEDPFRSGVWVKGLCFGGV